MFKKIELFALVSILALYGNIFAQSKTLKIGDKVPDFLLSEFLFTNNKTMKLSDLKGKLVIFDFWAPTCTPCIQAMPKYNILQQKYGEKIKIIPVVNLRKNLTQERYAVTRTKIEEFWTNNSLTKNTVLVPLVDTILADYFPTSGVPYAIWINGEGILVGLTSDIQESEIPVVLSGQAVNSAIVEDQNPIRYDFSTNLLKTDSSQITFPGRAWYTTITERIPGWIKPINMYNNDSPYFINSLKGSSQLQFLNLGVGMIYQKILLYSNISLGNNANLNRWIWEVKDKNKYVLPADKQNLVKWLNESTFCYQSIYPGIRSQAEMMNDMKVYFDNFFRLHTRIEKRLVDCWVLVRTSQDNRLLFSKREENFMADSVRQGKMNESWLSQYYREDISFVTMVYKSMESILYNLSDVNQEIMLDETNIKFPVKIAIDIKMEKGKQNLKETWHIDKIKSQLKMYGLDLIKSRREMEVFVITEKDYKNEKSGK